MVDCLVQRQRVARTRPAQHGRSHRPRRAGPREPRPLRPDTCIDVQHEFRRQPVGQQVVDNCHLTSRHAHHDVYIAGIAGISQNQFAQSRFKLGRLLGRRNRHLDLDHALDYKRLPERMEPFGATHDLLRLLERSHGIPIVPDLVIDLGQLGQERHQFRRVLSAQ